MVAFPARLVRLAAALSVLAACRASEPTVSVATGGYRFAWEGGEGVVERDGRRVLTLPRPFDYFIADGNAALPCGGRGDDLSSDAHAAILTSTLSCEDGTRLQARLSVSAIEGGDAPTQFELTAHTTVIAARGDGLAQRLRFQFAPAATAEAVLPGVWYKRNAHVEDCGPSLSGGTALHVREDRTTYPAVSLRTAGATFTLLRASSAAFDAVPATDASPAALFTRGVALYSEASGGTDIAGIGFDLSPAQPSLAAHFPYFEGPYSMQLRVNAAELTPAFDPWCRSGATRGFLDWPLVEKTGLVSTWRLVPAATDSYAELLGEQWRLAYHRYSPAPRTSAGTADEIRHSLAQFVAAHHDHRSSVAGFTYVMTVPHAIVLLPYFEPGFTGRTFLNARYLLAEGRARSVGDWIGKAESVYDTWITAGTSHGVFHDLWNAAKNQPASDRSVNGAPDGFAIRREAEAVWALLDAVRDEAVATVARPTWSAAVRAHLDRMVALQRADGSFCRRYRYDGECLDKNPGGTSAVVPALVHGYRHFGDPKLLRAAERAGVFVARTFIVPSEYFASTIDNPSENKEAATYALYTARLMAEEYPGNPRWVELARQAADAAITWIQLTDVPFYAPTPLAALEYPTRGLGNVAAGGGNLDAYAFEFPGSLAWLAEKTGDTRYADLARLILGAAMDSVAVPGHMKGLAEVGLAPEGVQKTMFSYFTGGKGSYAPFAAVGWTSASVFQAMDEVERVTGKSADEFLADVPYVVNPQ